MPGERIVISGTFLVDSESRMKAAAQGIFGAAVEDPVCGMRIDEQRAAAAGRMVEHGGEKYYFCADSCRQAFEQNPARYLKHAEPPAAAAHAAPAGPTSGVPPDKAKDPICGMTVTVKDAAAAGLVSRSGTATTYFCSEQCKKEFDTAAATR
jgi:YHS domain-containing protein